MNLPKIRNNDAALQLMQDKWASIINPLLEQPLSSSNILNNVHLLNGNNVINHLLGRKMQGWAITDVDASTTIYRSAPLNDMTITLNSSSACNINLLVF